MKHKKNSMALPPVQREVFDYIRGYYKSWGIAPSYRDIQNHFKFKSIASVQEHVAALIKKGKLEKKQDDSKHRISRQIIPKEKLSHNLNSVPFLGEIAAGGIRESIVECDKELVVDEHFGKNVAYALRVYGSSMIDVGIYEGDILLIDNKAPIKNNDIVVARVGAETTVKRIIFHASNIELIAENKTMKPMFFSKDKVVLQGKVVGLQRIL